MSQRFQTTSHNKTQNSTRRVSMQNIATKTDPVQIAFIQELRRFTGYVDRRFRESELKSDLFKSCGTGHEEIPARLSNTLFSLWNNYHTKLPTEYFSTQLINTGEYLYKVKEYSVAKQHCYGYHLKLLKERSPSEDYSSVYFSSGFANADKVKETCQAIFGNGLCTLKILEESDPHMNSVETVTDLLQVLDDFRSLTQHLIPHERYCWLVFNGTVHMYKIGKLLVDRGHTAQTLQYMVWCCVCMENVIPLMTLKFLSWRGTLYSAVCQCYLDLNQTQAAEMFSRRALQKVHQLAKVEEQSMSEATPESEAIFREVTVKLSTIIFKRVVFESRRPKKVVHRPKTRQNLKELQLLPFPRTATEKLVTDMFDGGASQFLAILEALSDSSRRICMSAPPKPDMTEGGDSLMDVWGELILGGYELILRSDSFPDEKMSTLSSAGSDVISLSGVLKYIKLAYTYEFWDYYSLAVSHFLPAVEEMEQTPYIVFLKDTIVLLDAMRDISPNMKTVTRPSTAFADSMLDGGQSPVVTPTLDNNSIQGHVKTDDISSLVILCRVLKRIQKNDDEEDSKGMFAREQGDMLVDAVMLLLSCLKDHYSRLVSSTTVKQFLVADRRDEMMQMMQECQQFSLWLNLYNIDPLIPGEMALKTAILLEAQSKKLQTSIFGSRSVHHEKYLQSQSLLADGILILQNSMEALEDVRNVKEISASVDYDPMLLVVDPLLRKTEGEVAHTLTVADLQLEMVSVHQRLRVQALKPEEYEKVYDWCNKNTLFLGISEMELATINTAHSERHLRESYQHLLKYWAEEKRLHASLQGSEQHGSVPSPPLLTSRTSTTMTFKPAPYTPPPGKKVHWYRLYGRSSSGSNIKVRLNDKLYRGLAVEVDARNGDELSVSGLNPYEKYQFAMAAFDENGEIIGGSIGVSSKPILASSPFSTLAAVGHLIQISHKLGVMSVAMDACNLLWNFFVLPNTASGADINIPTLNMKHINGASITLVRHLIESVLVSVDIAIREGALFCNVTCDKGPLKSNQLTRLGLCEKLLVAIELAGRINDTQLGTQAIIQTYGLLAPLIHFNIMCYPALKILLYCHAALTELPGVIKQKKLAGNIQHMTGVITFYLSKTLHQWGELEGANLVSENGHELLTQFDLLYSELSEQSHAITPSNKKKPVKRPDPPVKDRRITLKDMIQDPGVAPILKSDTLKAFEAHVLRHSAIYPTNTSGDPDFTGQEDFNLLYTAVANMSTAQAQKEVFKFRRRSRFLEMYVRVLEKALLECRPDLVIDWVGEAHAWLTRRNELLVAHKAHMPNKDIKTAATKHIEMAKQTLKTSDTSILKKSDNKTGIKMSKKEGAAELLRAILPDTWKRSCRLHRLRMITHEEMPWRAQLNVILAVSCYQQFKERLDARIKNMSDSNSSSEPGEYDMLPSNMFTVANVGSMMHLSEESLEDVEVPVHFSPSLEREKTNLSTLLNKKSSVTSSINSRQSKCGLSSERANKDVKLSYSTSVVQTFENISQALVLAHRGSHWGLLQNISSQLWRMAMDLQMKVKTLSTAAKEMLGLTDQTINDLLLKPMYYMAEFLLDYVENIIACNEDIDDASTIVGKPEDIDGGSSLHFDKFDDTTFVHTRWLHRYVMETLRLLYMNDQFEKLVYVGTRFNVLTNDVFGEQTYPLIIYSKRRLAERVAEYNEPWHTETSSVSIRSTVTPVQASHENVSPQVLEALRLCSVPLDHQTDQAQLAKVLSVRSHTALSLQYCRQLLLCYLAGYGKGHLKQGETPVSSTFNPGTAVLQKQYDKPADLFVAPLSSTTNGVIISTYEKTIEMLQVKGKSDLVVQAMHELANVLFHSGNTKGAFKWWCDALDTLLHTTNTIQNWHTHTPEQLLNKCQIWGCLLGGCIASNISQYVVNHSLDDRIDVCLLAANLFKALFHASLPHPASDYQYATHEIGEGFNIPSLIPGIDLLSDQFRCSGALLASALHYVSETLVRHEYALQALPVLTLYHYVAMSLLADTKHLMLARILKVQALTQLSLLSEALKLWSVVSQSEALPVPPTSHADSISNKTNVPEFNMTEPLNSPQNILSVEHAIKSKIPPVTSSPFTTNLSALAQLAHSGLLLGMAGVTDVIPQYNQGFEQGAEAHIKYRLCNSAEVMLTQLSHGADKEDVHFCEIEIAVCSYKLLCRIATQKQLGATTVNISNYGLTFMQRAYNLPRQEVISYDEICSKRRIDSLAWLQLKCAMIEGFALMTTMYGSNDCKRVCSETLEESKLFNCSDIHAWLSVKYLVLDVNADNIFEVERIVKDDLTRLTVPSCLGAFVCAGAVLYAITRSTNTADAISRLSKVKELLAYQHDHYYGQRHNVHTYMAPLSGLTVVLETDLKMEAVSEKMLSGGDVREDLIDIEAELSGTLKNCMIREALRAELLIRLGAVLRAQWEAEPTPERLVSLIKALTECVTATNYNLILAKEAFLEIALVTSIISKHPSDGTKQVTLEKRAAWSAIRSAALCNVTHDTLKGLEQCPVAQKEMVGKESKKLPSFAGLELNRELSAKMLDPQSKSRQPQPPANLSWVKLLSYLETLKRDQQTQGFSGLCPMSSPGLSSKITLLQTYLSANMPGWTQQCNIPTISKNINYLTIGRSVPASPSTVPPSTAPPSLAQPSPPPSSRESSIAGVEGGAPCDAASDGGIVLQWLKPRLPSKAQLAAQDSNQDLIMFYAFNFKAVKTNSPMFTTNSCTGFKVHSSVAAASIHTKVEYAHARSLIEEDLLKKEDTVTSQLAPPPSSRTSGKTAFSPEPYQPSEIKAGVVQSVAQFLGLDGVLSKEMLEDAGSLTTATLNLLENVFSPGSSVPHSNSEMCRWLLSFNKVIAYAKPAEKPKTAKSRGSTPKSK